MTGNPEYQDDEKFIRAISFILNFVEDEADTLIDMKAYLLARKRIEEYLADPSIGISYEEFHQRMVAEGLLDE
jgi:hypothetical protein